MAIATLFAGLLAAGAALAPQADLTAANTAEPVGASEEIEVAAVMDSGDPVQLLNRGVDFARQGETERARALHAVRVVTEKKVLGSVKHARAASPSGSALEQANGEVVAKEAEGPGVAPAPRRCRGEFAPQGTV